MNLDQRSVVPGVSVFVRALLFLGLTVAAGLVQAQDAAATADKETQAQRRVPSEPVAPDQVPDQVVGQEREQHRPEAPSTPDEREDANEAPRGAAAGKGSPQRFVPSEQVRADFDVSFPIDI